MQETKIPKIFNHAIAAAITPALRMREGEDFLLWQKIARARLAVLLGMGKFTKCDPKLDIEWREQREYGEEIRITFCPEEGYRAAAHIIVSALKNNAVAPGGDLSAGALQRNAHLSRHAEISR